MQKWSAVSKRESPHALVRPLWFSLRPSRLFFALFAVQSVAFPDPAIKRWGFRAVAHPWNLPRQSLHPESNGDNSQRFCLGVLALPLFNRNTLRSLLIPGGILLAAVAILTHTGWLTLALPALSFLFYSAVIGGTLLAWRFHSSRTALALFVLFLAAEALSLSGANHAALRTPGAKTLEALAVIVPLNFVLIALMHERGFVLSSLAPMGILFFVEATIVTVLCRAAELSPHPRPMPAASMPGYASVAFVIAGAILLVRFFLTRKPIDSALFWSLTASFLSLNFLREVRISTSYTVLAACILAISIIENSYLLAYHDELTALPSRRAFNDALLRLQDPYSIAVVDIDHFKRFNDTHGHDTGDQVLRLVATNLARVTGGGQAYRCGGEEFMILFPGKSTSDVIDHLEKLRASVETSEFRVRGADRRRAPRGPDRRNQRRSGRARHGDAIRALRQDRPQSALSVTVSIGVSNSTERNSHPDSVLKAADKALYRAKESGRNRIETAAAPRNRAKAAGIA